jgi:uncharacterized protein with ParB-like and HNH nuclease domain
MSYQSISVKEAINKINANNNGWFLPAIQRPYVWGSRYESEKYICKLFDSILRGYPIGGLIIWNSSAKIPHREFMNNYKDGNGTKLVEEGLWEREDKWLVYDGQQRLQTLFSCLKYSFNNKILIFDLLFDPKKADDVDETAFNFVKNNSDLELNCIKMNSLFTQISKNKIEYRKEILEKGEWTSNEEKLIEENIDLLWKIFVEEDKKSLAFFPISTNDESEVNEIFQRLNSGGIQLSQSDLLLSRIKEKSYDFEEQLQFASRKIFDSTGKGYIFDAYNILQILHLFVKGRVRVDQKKIKKEELKEFIKEWNDLEIPLEEFFSDFIYGQFKINNSSIIPRKISLLPLIAYVSFLSDKGIQFRKISESNLTLMKQYFIKSQINGWDLQSYIDNFYEILFDEDKNSKIQFEFPLKKFEEFIKKKGSKRYLEIYENVFIDYRWFSLKILTPNRIYQFDPDIKRRFNPEIDHIFPIKLKDQSDEYKESVDIIWNMQPVKGDVNGFKLNHHPLDFFTNKLIDKSGNVISGDKYYSEYDFITKISSDLWMNYKNFINVRKEKMKSYLAKKYGLIITKDN